MASNDNGKHKFEEEVKSSMVRKRLQLSDDAGSDDDSSNSAEEEVPSEESSMNQLCTSEDKLLVKCGRGIVFGDDSDTTSPSSEPLTPEMLSSHVHSDPDSSDDDDDDDYF
jgi:hypothetical protein